MPERLQRKRTKGFKMKPNSIYVGRGSIWGNPFEVGRDGTPAEVVAKYRIYLETKMRMDAGTDWRERFARLCGRDLACWCKPGDPCHADILLEIANA